jgi:DNA-binding transcriptional LysR family regulator
MVLRSDHQLAQIYPETVPLQVFADYPVIWREPGSSARNVMQQAFKEAALDIPVNIEVSGVAGIKGCVRPGLGISYASSRALKHGDASLTYRRIGNGLEWQLNILIRKRIRSRAAQAFLELL